MQLNVLVVESGRGAFVCKCAWVAHEHTYIKWVFDLLYRPRRFSGHYYRPTMEDHRAIRHRCLLNRFKYIEATCKASNRRRPAFRKGRQMLFYERALYAQLSSMSFCRSVLWITMYCKIVLFNCSRPTIQNILMDYLNK